MFVAKCFQKDSFKGKSILEARRPLLMMFSLDVEFYLAFHAEGKKMIVEELRN